MYNIYTVKHKGFHYNFVLHIITPPLFDKLKAPAKLRLGIYYLRKSFFVTVHRNF